MKEGYAVSTGQEVVDGADASWRKSSFSEAGNCVEVAKLGDVVGIRDSQNPESGHLVFSAPEFAGFIALINAGEFNLGDQ